MKEDYLFHPHWRTEEIANIDGNKYMKTIYRNGITITSPINASINASTFADYPEYERAIKAKWELDQLNHKLEKEGGLNLNMYTDKTPQGHTYAVTCRDKKDLSVDCILKNLAKIKGRLMMVCAPIRVDHFECKMTPIVKQNIISAHKKLNMFGKTPPIIARFDDFGNRLSDKINIDTMAGIDLKIVNPDDYGPYYFEIKALICDLTDRYISKVEGYKPDYIDEDDLPF